MAERILGDWIKDLEASGELEDNPGYGKPLELDDGYMETPETLRMAYKILKDGGHRPPEVELVRQLADVRERLAKEGHPEARGRLQSEIAELEMKVASSIEALSKRL